MDKKIAKIERGAKKEVRELESLKKEDKRRDKKCDYGEKMLAKKKNKKK